MKNLDFEWITDEFMLYCRNTQLREKTAKSCAYILPVLIFLPVWYILFTDSHGGCNMKYVISFLLVAVMIFSLCACGSQQIPTVPDVAQGKEAVHFTETVLVMEETESITELLVSQHYHCILFRGDETYALYIELNPLSASCTIRTGNEPITLLHAPYQEDSNGNITICTDTQTIRFQREKTNLILEEGSLAAYLLSDPKSVETIPLDVGTVLEFTSEKYVYDGIYVLDASDPPVSFDEVLIDINLTEMSFALKCYDGNVVKGSLEIEEGFLYCQYEGGCIAFDIVGQGSDTTLYVCYPENVGQSYLMYYPQTEFHYAHQFRYAPMRTDVLSTSSSSDFFESKKNMAVGHYSFTCPVEGVDRTFCYLKLNHYGMTNTWELIRGAQYIPLEAEENPDGTLILSTSDMQWQFHRENNGLIFDGGSPLEAYGELVDGVPKYTVTLEPGDYFRPDSFHYLYDTLYIVPSENGVQDAALLLDKEYQRLIILSSDGSVLEAPYTVTDGGLYFPMGTHSSRLTFGGHSLYGSNPHTLTIVEGKDDFWFIPVLDTDIPESTFQFTIRPPATSSIPENSILVFEDYITVVSYPGMYATGELLLCPHDNSFYFNTEFSAYYAHGTYEESEVGITLNHGSETTTLHREDNAVVIDGGSHLCISGMPFTSVATTRQNLSEGTHIPLYQQGWLYNGTYTVSCEAGTSSVSFDTKNRTFVLTDAQGSVYEGNFLLESKFVICNATIKQFQFIPYGDQIRLNQSEGDKVLPVENDFIFFDFSK